MDFNFLVDGVDVSKKDVIGLAIYYIDFVEKRDAATKADIKEVVNSSRSSVRISSKHLSTYLDRLEEDGRITQADAGYLVTHEGKAYFGELANFEADAEEGMEIIPQDFVEGQFFADLVGEINACYRIKAFSGARVLSRKLLENLLIDIIRGEYGVKKLNLYYDADDNRFHSFSTLVKNFSNNIEDFKPYSGAVEQKLVDQIQEIRESGNTDAHSLEIEWTDNEIQEFQDRTRKLAKVLFDLRRKVVTTAS